MQKLNKDIASNAVGLRKAMTRLQQIHAHLKYELDFGSFLGGVSSQRRGEVKGLMKSLKKEVKLSYKYIDAIQKADLHRCLTDIEREGSEPEKKRGA